MRYEVSETEVLDMKNDLIQQTITKDNFSYQQALNYAKQLSKSTDLSCKVPSKHDLMTIIDLDYKNPASSFPNMPIERFWICSKGEACIESAYVVDFYDGRPTIMSCNWSIFIKLVHEA